MHTCDDTFNECKECERENWKACCRAANRLADLVCATYIPKEQRDSFRKVFPTATWDYRV